MAEHLYHSWQAEYRQHIQHLAECKTSREDGNESVELAWIAAHPWTPIGQQVGVLGDDCVDQAIDSQISHLSISLKWCNNELYACSFQRLQAASRSDLVHVCAQAEGDLCTSRETQCHVKLKAEMSTA